MDEETKVCPGCGLVVKSYVKYCAECGSFIPDNEAETSDSETADFVVNDNADYSDNAYDPNQAGCMPPTDKVMTKQEYFKWKGDRVVSNSVNLAAIACFVLAGFGLPSTVLLFMSGEALLGFSFLLDISVYIGLGLGAYIKKSKGCLLAASIYYGVGSLLVMGSLTAWVAIFRIAVTVCLINGFIKANKFDNEYKYYVWQMTNKDNL